MKKILCFLLIAVLVFAFVACASEASDETYDESDENAVNTSASEEAEENEGCEHNYIIATCVSPRKCTKCGETKGSALGHDYSAATCTAAQKCKRCGETKGAAINHVYSIATCTKPQTCTMCGATKGTVSSHTYSAATCTSPQKCTKCSATSGSALGHSYSGQYCTRCSASNPNYTSHTHYYSSSVTKQATCATTGVKTFRCSCGASYTETIPKTTSHDWKYATCTAPDTCKDCGITRGEAEGHDYERYNGWKCRDCGQLDPEAANALAKCSLTLPSLPKSVSYYGYGNTINSTVKVTGITYDFEYYGNGKVILTAKFSGEKTYDKNGSGQSSAAKIGWKLYDPQGNVFRTGTFSSPSVAMGEKFANQEDDLIYNFEATNPGTFRLEILNVN